VIAIISPSTSERMALTALCDCRGWISTECDSVRAFRKLLQRMRPRIVLTRRRLEDGYSDDVVGELRSAGVANARILILISAATPAATEARQVALGADCVLRDPVRPDVLVEYLRKYHDAMQVATADNPTIELKSFEFAGATVDPIARTLRCRRKIGHLTPHEVDLIELLLESEGGVLTYEMLYQEILGRKFRGETSNMRVLLGKLAGSASSVGVPLRHWVEVIPKLGYRYRPPPVSEPPVERKPRPTTRSPRK
jgi:DNA-binding response OmpR family regulator